MIRHAKNLFDAGISRVFQIAAMTCIAAMSGPVSADIIVTPGTTFNLSARDGYISVADGGSIYTWGYTAGATMQLPGPTLEVTEGDTVTVNLTNALPAAAGNVSIVFPGHDARPCAPGALDVDGNCTAVTGIQGAVTQEAPTGGTVTYTFVADTPGTYTYYSGTRPDLQVEMGLYGTIIVRPATVPTGCTSAAYSHAGTCYDREFLFLLSEIDLQIHQAAEDQKTGAGPIDIGTGDYNPVYWLLNGRAGPDTMAAAGTGILPTQPYNSLPTMKPGEKLLLRIVGGGRDFHPFHTHGNHVRVLARDGNLILSATDASELAGPLLFTVPSAPGGTVDAIFEWTGEGLGWDIYGTVADNPHTCTDGDSDGYADADSDYPSEWCADHNAPIPVDLPALSSLAFGGFYSGSPYLGALGSLPPGEGGLNPNAGFAYMWHSHTERELVNNDVFPGGMMTMLIVESADIDPTILPPEPAD
jgi:FtsP/CotA-like multicopper oxidase with cupredoxin domain